jgi:YHS domain-containing protein
MMRCTVKVGAFVFAVLAIFPLFGVAHANSVNQVDGVALKGYDPVAYFTESKAAKGSDKFTAQYRGVTYKFESAAHRDTFLANPEKYLPQYGGYCAYGVSRGDKADIEPHAFSVVGGKLYLNYSKTVRFMFQHDLRANIEKANENWPLVSAQPDPQ